MATQRIQKTCKIKKFFFLYHYNLNCGLSVHINNCLLFFSFSDILVIQMKAYLFNIFYLPASVGTGMVDLTPVTVGTLPGSGAIVRLEPEFDAPVLE